MLWETGSLAKVTERWESERPTIYELGNSLPMRTRCCPAREMENWNFLLHYSLLEEDRKKSVPNSSRKIIVQARSVSAWDVLHSFRLVRFAWKPLHTIKVHRGLETRLQWRSISTKGMCWMAPMSELSPARMQCLCAPDTLLSLGAMHGVMSCFKRPTNFRELTIRLEYLARYHV